MQLKLAASEIFWLHQRRLQNTNYCAMVKPRPKMDAIALPDLRCEKVNDYYVLRDGAAGLFLAASGFPKPRNRAPLLEEILPHKDKIDVNTNFFGAAPLRPQRSTRYRAL